MENGPLTRREVRNEIMDALEPHAAAGGSELGIYEMRVSRRHKNAFVILLAEDDGVQERFLVQVRRLRPKKTK